MSRDFRNLVERQIQKALTEGSLTGLKGEGAPLPERKGEAHSDMATAVAMRILAEAGVLPEELELKKLLNAAKEAYRDAGSEDEKRLAMAVIADLDQRYNIAVEARRKFMRP